MPPPIDSSYSSRLFADVWQQGHETGSFDGNGDCSLKSRAITGALAAMQFTLRRTELLQRRDVLEIHKRRPGAALFGAEAAAVVATLAQFLANHLVPNLVIARENGS